MKIVFNLVLLAISAVLAYFLYKGIQEPIAFNDVYRERQEAVASRLRDVRTAQELYRDITGQFAPSFDTLEYVLRNDNFQLISASGDPDDPNFTGEIVYDTTYVPAIDSVQSLGLNLEELRYVPYTNQQTTFEISADTIEYQSTTVPVVEVGTPFATFMGKYASRRFARYDRNYDPRKMIKFGDMNRPNLSGTWD